jgi:hypothetical protein
VGLGRVCKPATRPKSSGSVGLLGIQEYSSGALPGRRVAALATVCRRALGVCVCALLATAISGCGKTMSEEDCRAIANNVREAWRAETRNVEREGATAGKAAGVIKSEGDALAADWSAECRSKLLGQEISAKEHECLLKGKSLEDLRKCSATR